jgi:hypothetical protein
MITRFTCPCGASVEIDAPSYFLAREAAAKAGWGPTSLDISGYDCPSCVKVAAIEKGK